MAVQYLQADINSMLDDLEASTGTAPILHMHTGAQPADCGTANSGTLLSSMVLPSDWLAAATGGTKSKAGTWEDASAAAGGTAAHFRITKTNVTHIQGSVGQGSGDIDLDDTSIVAGQQVTISTFVITGGNA